MKSTLADPRSAAIASILLALPFTIVLLLFLLGYEPEITPLASSLGVNESRLGSIFVIASFLLLLPASAISLVVVIREQRAGKGLFAAPLNLLLAALTLSVILVIAGLIIVDQYPCWIGVPNCD